MDAPNEIAVVQAEAMTLSDRARSMEVIDQQSYNMATELYLGLGALEKKIIATHAESIAAGLNAHRTALALRDVSLDPVLEAKKIIKPKATAWEQEQKIKREEEERIAREERERIYREQVAKAREEARIKQAELDRIAAEQAKAEEDARIKLALEFEEMGGKEEAEEILSAPIAAPVVAPRLVVPAYFPPPTIIPKKTAPAFVKASGFKSRTIYSCEVIDLDALKLAALNDASFMRFLIADTKELNDTAADRKEEFSIPGCKLVRRTV